MQKKHKLNLMLNEIRKSEDPTIIPCTYIILDFDKSNNNVIVEQDVALEASKTLINKPIVAKYTKAQEANTPTDNFTDHEYKLDEDRYGNLTMVTETTPIGVFTTEGYMTTFDIDGQEKEVLVADAVMWHSRFPDACDLILEWYDRGINVNTSCEYLYSNYSFKDGVEYHHSPIYFEGHAILASEDRGEQSVVLPAYDSSKLLSINEIKKFNKLVAQAYEQNSQEEDLCNMKCFKKINEISHDDIRSMIYEQLDKSLDKGVYSWICDVYETYFVVNLYSFTEGSEFDKNFKYSYTNENNVVTVDLESKTEVKIKRDWVEVSEFEAMQNSLAQLEENLKAKEDSISELETQVNSKEEAIKQLNQTIETLEPIKEQYEAEKLEKAINEKKDFYQTKFVALNAKEKFESEEVQNLICNAVQDTEEGKQATLQLNSMLVDLVVTPAPQDTIVREVASKRENLLPKADDFDSRYSL